nr:DNA-dependent metalloprotease SPRTN-like isoform X2 [Cherax quadricarinatus]
MSEIDLMLAIQLQARFDEELRASREKQEQELKSRGAVPGSTTNKWKAGGLLDEVPQEKLSVSLIDASWEMIDPNPDIHTLFLVFNDQFFWGRLSGVEVKWSPRMTLCAGVCSYEGGGGLCSVRLSVPLLKLRPRKDLVETLLHEMIHAYLFVTANNRDREGHGPEFHKHMHRINSVAGTNITVFHSFHDEVAVYRQHIWQCNGPCKTRRPYFGLVKRAMNREPGPRDPWWEAHRQSCGGTYSKIQEPEGYSDKKKKSLATDAKKLPDNCGDIRKFIGFKGRGNSVNGGTGSSHASNLNGKNSASKNSMPVFGVTNKSYDNESNDSTGSDSYRGAKLNNIHGFESRTSGTVKQVSVDNASQSKVHGFGGSCPKKPCNVPVESSKRMSNGKAVGRPSGGFGTAVAVRGSGSRTVTVKGKTSTKMDNQVDASNKVENATSLPTVFQGQGYSLGGPSTGVSRLLSQGNELQSSESPMASTSFADNANISHMQENSSFKKENYESSPWISRPTTGRSPVKEDNTSQSSQKSLNSYFASPSSKYPDHNGDLGECPVCNKLFSKWKINQHLDECIGMFDDSRNVRNTDNADLKRPLMQNKRKESVFTVSDDDDDQAAAESPCSASKTSKSKGSMTDTSPGELYPCPVCNELFSDLKINQHLDKHF